MLRNSFQVHQIWWKLDILWVLGMTVKNDSMAPPTGSLGSKVAVSPTCMHFGGVLFGSPVLPIHLCVCVYMKRLSSCFTSCLYHFFLAGQSSLP